MTNERLEELKDLSDAIDELEKAISYLENTDYRYIYISGMCKDGVPDIIVTTKDMGTDGLVELIRSFLADKLDNMKKKFEEA